MAIKAHCESCGTSFKAKDEFAGKRVKCPKCGDPMTVPNKSLALERRQTTAVTTAAAHNPLLDLLDEAGVEAVPKGPICENCGIEVAPDAVVCVACGFNMATGLSLETESYEDEEEAYGNEELSDAEKIMAKAEREIEDMPVTAVGQNFGDGADSFLVALAGMVIMAVLVALGVGVIYLMDLLGDKIDSALISFYASIGLYVLCVSWITLIAFIAKPVQGVICVCTGGLYCIIFGFMQRGLLLPTIVLCSAIFIGLISYLFAFAPKSEFGMQFHTLKEFVEPLIALSL